MPERGYTSCVSCACLGGGWRATSTRSACGSTARTVKRELQVECMARERTIGCFEGALYMWWRENVTRVAEQAQKDTRRTRRPHAPTLMPPFLAREHPTTFPPIETTPLKDQGLFVSSRRVGSREGGPKRPIERRPNVDQSRCGEGDEKGWVEGGWSKIAYRKKTQSGPAKVW